MRPPRQVGEWAARAMISVNTPGHTLICVEGDRGYTLLGLRSSDEFSGVDMPEHTHAAEDAIPTILQAIARMAEISSAWPTATWFFGALLHGRWRSDGLTWNMQVSPAGGLTSSDAWQVMAVVTRGRGLQAVLAEHQHVVLPVFQGTLLDALAYASTWRPADPEWCACTSEAL